MHDKWVMNVTANWTVSDIKNYIWLAVQCGQPIKSYVTVEDLRAELLRRGEDPIGYHNT